MCPQPHYFLPSAGRRTIKVTLAFDPPVRHSRMDYAGVGMSFRLVRGCDAALISEHYRRRTGDEDRFSEIPKRFQCTIVPGPQIREKGSLQSGVATFKADVSAYGDCYYLVVRSNGYAELRHQSREASVHSVFKI